MEETERPSLVRVPGQFEAFYQADYQAVLALVYGLTGNRWAAEDLVQEAFLRAHRDWDRVGRLDSPPAWVRRVAINLARSRWRKLRSERVARSAFASQVAPAEPLTPEDETFWEEVRRLPRRQAQAIALRYIDDLSVSEIAEVMRAAKGTVRALLHQGRTRMERELTAKGWDA